MNTDPTAIVRAANPMAELVQQIRAEHAAAGTAIRKGIEHARRAGELLLKAKAQCRHGGWHPWVTKNLPDLGIRQVQRYMRVASKWTELNAPDPNASGTTHLPSIDGALAVLSGTAQEVPEPEPDAPELLSPATADDPEERDRGDRLRELESIIEKWIDGFRHVAIDFAAAKEMLDRPRIGAKSGTPSLSEPISTPESKGCCSSPRAVSPDCRLRDR